MKTSVEIDTLKSFIEAGRNALSLLEVGARIKDGDVYNDLHNACEDAEFVVAKAQRREYQPNYRGTDVQP